MSNPVFYDQFGNPANADPNLSFPGYAWTGGDPELATGAYMGAVNPWAGLYTSTYLWDLAVGLAGSPFFFQ